MHSNHVHTAITAITFTSPPTTAQTGVSAAARHLHPDHGDHSVRPSTSNGTLVFAVLTPSGLNSCPVYQSPRVSFSASHGFKNEHSARSPWIPPGPDPLVRIPLSRSRLNPEVRIAMCKAATAVPAACLRASPRTSCCSCRVRACACQHQGRGKGSGWSGGSASSPRVECGAHQSACMNRGRPAAAAAAVLVHTATHAYQQ